MSQLFALISSFRTDEEGQGLAEYALILALIAIVAIIALIFLGGQVSRSSATSASRSNHRRQLKRRPPVTRPAVFVFLATHGMHPAYGLLTRPHAASVR